MFSSFSFLLQGAFTDRHFDQDLNFLATEEDPVTKKVNLCYYVWTYYVHSCIFLVPMNYS